VRSFSPVISIARGILMRSWVLARGWRRISGGFSRRPAGRPSFTHWSRVSGEISSSAAPVSRLTYDGVRSPRSRLSTLRAVIDYPRSGSAFVAILNSRGSPAHACEDTFLQSAQESTIEINSRTNDRHFSDLV
jgi:hypothetical protein